MTPVIVSIVIPVYNEYHTVARLLAAARAAGTGDFGKEIIVVDDGSDDGTTGLLRELCGDGCTAVFLPANRGKSAAIREGLRHVGGDIVLIQDADLEYSPDEYPCLLAPFNDPGVAVVYGSRFLNCRWPQGMRLPYLMANRLFTGVTNLLYGAGLTDEGTAFKAFRTEVLQTITLESNGFEFCPEVTAKLLKNGHAITEVPIGYSARSRKEGKKPRVIDALLILWTLVKYRVTS